MIRRRFNHITISLRGAIALPTLGKRLLEHAPTLIGIVLISLISLSLAWQTRQAMTLQNSTPQAAKTAAPTPQAKADPTQVLPLFDDPRGHNSAPPATNLRLTLMGSFVHPDKQRSTAIITQEGGKPKRFHVGETIQEGISLHAVYRDRVELERQGRLETLMFPKQNKPLLSSSEITLPASSDNLPAVDAGSYSPPPPAPSDDIAKLEESASNLKDQEFQQLRQRMLNMRKDLESADRIEVLSEPIPVDTP